MIDSLIWAPVFVPVRVTHNPSTGKWDKVPLGRNGRPASALDPVNWIPYVDACCISGGAVGIVLTEGLGLACLDVDHAYDPTTGQWSALAIDLCNRFPLAYVELSVSGTGLHIIFAHDGTLDPKRRVQIDGLGVYTHSRFILLTGTGARGDALVDYSAELRACVGRELPTAATSAHDDEWRSEPLPGWTGGGTDEQIVLQIRNKIPTVAFGNGGVTGAHLWDADFDVIGPAYGNDRSAIDLAFANVVLPLVGFNHERALELMCQSELYREKYERRSYLEATLRRASDLRKHFSHWEEAPKPLDVTAGTTPQRLPESEYAILARHTCTDQANAKRIQRTYGDRLICCAKKFYAWTGKRWEEDEVLPSRFVLELSAIVLSESRQADALALATEDLEKRHHLETQATALAKWSKDCEMSARLDSALRLIRNTLAFDPEKLDASPWLFNCRNGTVDLRTGEFRAHDPKDFITRMVDIDYDPSQACPRFDRFISEIYRGDKSVSDFMRRWYGYCATGSTREQILLINWGEGANGKGTLIELMNSVLGEYQCTSDNKLITDTMSSGSGAASPELYRLWGKRLSTISEIEDGAVLSEAIVKGLTGSDTITARPLYGQQVEFKPTHKLQILTNKRPVVKGTDHAIWRRVMLVRYGVQYGKAGHPPKDSTLSEVLASERQGVLNWIVRGAREWFSNGLTPPVAVTGASEDYREDQDTVGKFISESLTTDPLGRIERPRLYGIYKAWCDEQGIKRPVMLASLLRTLESRVPDWKPPFKTNGVWWVGGITAA